MDLKDRVELELRRFEEGRKSDFEHGVQTGDRFDKHAQNIVDMIPKNVPEENDGTNSEFLTED